MPTEAMREKLAKGRAARFDYERADGMRGQRERNRAERLRLLLDEHNANPSAELLAAWEPIRAEMREMVEVSVWQWWVEAVHPHRVEGGVWVLACPENSRDWVKLRFGRLWEKACRAPVRFVICDINQGRTS
jgi:hypothetical protein